MRGRVAPTQDVWEGAWPPPLADRCLTNRKGFGALEHTEAQKGICTLRWGTLRWGTLRRGTRRPNALQEDTGSLAGHSDTPIVAHPSAECKPLTTHPGREQAHGFRMPRWQAKHLVSAIPIAGQYGG